MTARELTIANVIEEWPGAVTVFERHRIEYYLHGDMEFGEVCRNLKKNPAIILDEVRQESSGLPKKGTRDWTVAFTIDYILKNHHEPTYRMLEEIHLLFRQLEQNRGFLNYDLSLLKESLLDLEDYLIEHLQEEETEIFPLLLAKTSAGSHPRRDVELFDAITWLREDHLLTGSILKRIHELGAQVGDSENKSTLVELFSRLGDLERDLHYHMHLENNVLFGKFT